MSERPELGRESVKPAKTTEPKTVGKSAQTKKKQPKFKPMPTAQKAISKARKNRVAHTATLRAQGMIWEEVAEELGVSFNTATNYSLDPNFPALLRAAERQHQAHIQRDVINDAWAAIGSILRSPSAENSDKARAAAIAVRYQSASEKLALQIAQFERDDSRRREELQIKTLEAHTNLIRAKLESEASDARKLLESSTTQANQGTRDANGQIAQPRAKMAVFVGIRGVDAAIEGLTRQVEEMSDNLTPAVDASEALATVTASSPLLHGRGGGGGGSGRQ